MSSSSPAAALQSSENSAAPRGSAQRSNGLFQSPAERTLLLSLILVAAVLVAYSPITHNGFVRYDDDEYITENPHVQAGLTGATVKWAFTSYDHANWIPLSWLSHALDYEMFGLNAEGHHYVSVLIHAGNAVLLFLLLQSATGLRWRSLMVAALFALHPVNVESVAWAAERKNVLSMLFFLLALYAYGWYARKPSVLRYGPVFLLFALGLMSKSQVVTFPFVLWLWDYWPLGRIGVANGDQAASDLAVQVGGLPRMGATWLVLEKVPLLLLSAASAWITIQAEKAGGAVRGLSQYSLLLRLETALVAYVRYLGKAIWPANLVALYPHPTRLYAVWQVAGAVAVLLLVTALVIAARQRRYLLVGWLWFLGTLVPMIGLVQVGQHGMADRFAYIPFLGLFVMWTWLVADVAAEFFAGTDAARGVRQPWLPATALAVPAIFWLLSLGVLTHRQVGYWHDTLSFWQRTLNLTEENYVAEDNLGEFLFRQNRIEEGAAHFRAALAIRPQGVAANLNLGAYEDRRGNLPEAIARYQVVLENGADDGIRALAFGSMGFAYRQMGQPMKAKQCFEAAAQLTPDRARPRIGLGLLAQDAHNLPEAVRQYSMAESAQPAEVVYLLLAQALRQEGKADEAKAIYNHVANSPNLPEAEKEVRFFLVGK